MPSLNYYAHSMSVNPADGKIMPNMQIAVSNVKDYAAITTGEYVIDIIGN